MELNKIQKQIYEQYQEKGKVWADCPRQCGKTELIILIAKEEMEKGNKVFIKTVSQKLLVIILEEKLKKFKNLIVDREQTADVIIYDELYYDTLVRRGEDSNKKIVCLRTRVHPLLTFSYLDLDKKWYPDIDKLKKEIGKECFELEFKVK